MESLPAGEIPEIAGLQRDAGVRRLSSHFSWPEFCDERRRFHQEFVYDVAMFAAGCGFPWPDVSQTAATAKRIFPQLDGLDIPKLLSLLTDALSECLPNLNPVHRYKFTQFLVDTCTTRQRLFQAVVGGATNMSIVQLHLEVELPPTPYPLAQGSELHELHGPEAGASDPASLTQFNLAEEGGGAEESQRRVESDSGGNY